MKKLLWLLEALTCIIAVALVVWLKNDPEDSFWEKFLPVLAFTVIVGICIHGVKWLVHRLPHFDQMKAMLKPFKYWGLLIVSLGLTVLEAGALISAIRNGSDTKTLVILGLGLILFGSGFIMTLREVIGRKQAPRYDTDQNYLYLLSAFNRTPLEWKHITGFSIVEVEQMGHKKMIAVLMDNIEEQRANETRRMWQLSYDMFVPQYGTLYFIPTERCVLTPEQLLGQLQAELHRHQHS